MGHGSWVLDGFYKTDLYTFSQNHISLGWNLGLKEDLSLLILLSLKHMTSTILALWRVAQGHYVMSSNLKIRGEGGNISYLALFTTVCTYFSQ